MKKAISILWAIFIVCIVVFILSVFMAKSDAWIWRVFSIAMPIAGVSLWGAIILMVVEYWRSRKE